MIGARPAPLAAAVAPAALPTRGNGDRVVCQHPHRVRRGRYSVVRSHTHFGVCYSRFPGTGPAPADTARGQLMGSCFFGRGRRLGGGRTDWFFVRWCCAAMKGGVRRERWRGDSTPRRRLLLQRAVSVAASTPSQRWPRAVAGARSKSENCLLRAANSAAAQLSGLRAEQLGKAMLVSYGR